MKKSGRRAKRDLEVAFQGREYCPLNVGDGERLGGGGGLRLSPLVHVCHEC